MKKNNFYLLIIGVSLSIFLAAPVSAQSTVSRLAGKILLQVESKGEAWYINPKDGLRYYLGRPDDAYSLMRKMSLGISEKEFSSWSKGAPAWSIGGFYLRPESHGEAYYVSSDSRWNYLGRPADAWQLLRSKGLGITNNDLDKIPVANNFTSESNELKTVVQPVVEESLVDLVNTENKTDLLPENTSKHTLNWLFNNKQYSYSLNLSDSLRNGYKNSVNTSSYKIIGTEQESREKFYALLFVKKSGDNSISDLIGYARSVTSANYWTEDQTVEFLMALVQYIPYDSAKLTSGNLEINFPYETLYKNLGICSDKTILAVSLLRSLGYGSAIIDLPDLKHSAAGIACPKEQSLANSGYCFVETTNYFPLGTIPLSINSGQAETEDIFSNFFNEKSLGKIEIYQKSSGKVYQGVSKTKQVITNLQSKKTWIDQEKNLINEKSEVINSKQKELQDKESQLKAYQDAGDLTSYRTLALVYNEEVDLYNTALSEYKLVLENYNNTVKEYNQGIASFYQN